MPCDTLRLKALAEKERKAVEAKRKAELKKLEAQIAAGTVTVKKTGERVEFVGWQTDRESLGHWHDDCAFRTLMAEGSSALRMALSRQQPDRMTRTVAR